MDKLSSPRIIEGILKKYDLHFNKRFGQNFLIDENIVEKIVLSGDVTKDDVVLEVGPGIGTMTQILARDAHAVVSVEIDKKLIPVLKDTLGEYDNVQIVEGDILKTDVYPYLKSGLDMGKNLKIVANLPYYVTTPIIMGFLEGDLPIKKMTFMIQKEVGERLCAKPSTKAYGSLTIAAQYYADPQLDFYVPATVFMPKPNVDSVVITMDKREAPSFETKDKALFFKLVRAGFLNRRKTLINSLMGNTQYAKADLLSAMEKADIPSGIRGEALTGADFARLADHLEKL